MFHELKLDALVVIGGDGTLAIAHQFSKLGVPLVGVPKTIDNDIVETTNTFGFDTAVELRNRRDRSPARHRRSAPPRHRRRSDGPVRGLDCALLGRGRRRGRRF